jgi:hypothetical protein
MRAVNMSQRPIAKHLWSFSIIATASLTLLRQAYGDDLENTQKILDIIPRYADRICTRIPLIGTGSNTELSGDAKTQLAELFRKVFDLGLEASGKYTTQEYEGLLQGDLAVSIKNSDDCRLAVSNKLISVLLPSLVPSPHTAPSVPPGPAATPGPDAGSLSPADAASLAEGFASQLFAFGPTTVDDLMKKMSLPFCSTQIVYPTATGVRSALEQTVQSLSSGYGRVISSAIGIQTLMDYMSPTTDLNAFTRQENIRQCQGMLAPRDYIASILIQLPDLQRQAAWDVIVDWRTGLVKGILM